MVVQLRPHQREAVEKLSNGKVLVGGVGTGKTITSLVYFYEKILGGTVGDYSSVKNPMDLYVFTTARKRDELDWQTEAMHVGISTHDNSGTPGVKLTVDSYNNIDEYKEVQDAFIILDEQRMVGSGAWTKAFIKLAKANQWIMLSATPGDKWEDYISLFIANGFYKNRTEFKRRHIVYNNYGPFPKVDHYVEVGQLIRLRNHILVEMPYERHTKRHIHEIRVDYDKELFEKVMKQRWHVYENRPLKDVSELFSVMRKVVNSSASRLDTVRTLLRTHPRMIVFYNFDYELKMLRTLIEDQTTSIFPGSMIHEQESIGTTSSGSESETSSTARMKSPSSLNVQPVVSPSDEKISNGMSQIQSTLCEESCKNQNYLEQIQKPADTTSSEFMENPILWQSALAVESPLTSGSSMGNRMTSMENIKSGLETTIQKNQSARDGLVMTEWNGHKHQKVPTTDRWVYLVQYVAGAEAWNCTTTDTVVFFSLTYSYKNFVQAQGRIDRLDTPFTDLHYYVLASDSVIDKAVLKSLKNKEDFNERKFIE